MRFGRIDGSNSALEFHQIDGVDVAGFEPVEESEAGECDLAGGETRIWL